MRSVLLIAWREYRQYIFSRGFLLFLIMFPISVIFVGGVVGFLEHAKPARSYVVVDETGRFAGAIEEEIEWRWKRSIVAAWDAYLAIAVDETAIENELIPEPFAPGSLSRLRLRAFFEEGLDAAKIAIEPHLHENAPAFIEPKPQFARLPLPEDVAAAPTVEAAADLLRPYLLDDKRLPGADRPLFAAIIIPAGFAAAKDAPPAEFWSRNLTDTALENAVSSALDYALQREAVAALGLSPEDLERVASLEAPLASFRPDKDDADAKLSLKDRVETTLPAAMTYMLLVVIFGVGNLLLTNTIEERSNKIVEVLLSSVTANELMLGKLIGIGAVGLTMPTIFVIGGLVAAFAAGGGEWTGAAASALFGSNLLAVYLFYFLSAYVIFAMIFLAIGAMSNSLQDAQSYMGPVMLIIFLPLPFMIMVYQNPNGLIASILTWIPIYTPYAVMMRAVSDPPLWEIIGATVLMLAFAFVFVRAMGRIFKSAILQASPPKVRDVWRLVRGGAR
ncbi:MAG: ABC transporter permease [Parvularculaceae bacterium]